jgi:hypothetical protein
MMQAIALAVICAAALFLALSADARPRTSCECEQLQAIRRLLEHQFRVVCDELHCESVGGEPPGGELP